jgi:hypothetical protein
MLTITIAETTIAWVSGDPSADSESITGTITSDTTAKHILATVATESYTGSTPTTPILPGAKLYFLYSISGTTLTLALNPTGYPADLGSAYIFTKQ